ncbi:MAG: hypothetical protein JW772_01905 [Candidatus Diapherotrites archaeon]|nr:hypothetical protein [Candidatus Diapherotrites archaeon]
MITKVSLENWRTHAKSDFEFGRGTNVLVGAMGAGKSLPYTELALVKEGNIWKKQPIGEIVERSLKKSGKKEKRGNGAISTNENPFSIKVQTINPNTLKMEERQVSSFIKHKAPEELVKIRTRQGKKLVTTLDHSMLIFEEGKIKPMQCKDLKKGSFIPCPKKMVLKGSPDFIELSALLPEFRHTNRILDGLAEMKRGLSATTAAKETGVTKDTLANWRDRKYTHSPNLIIARRLSHAVPTKIRLSNEFARLCGAYVAEGFADYCPKKSRYTVGISNTDEKFLKLVRKDWKMIFPEIPMKCIQKRFLQANSAVASALFLRMFGHKAKEKKLPEFIFWFDENQLSDFLKMYFEGDGYISTTRPELSCSSKSVELVDGLQTLLCRWGIISRIRKVKRPQGKYYELLVLPKHIPIFAKHVSFLSERKQRALLTWCETIKTRKRWDGVDVIPNIANLLKNLTQEYSLGKRNNKKMRGISKELQIYRKKENLGREKLKRILNQIFENYKFKKKAFSNLEKIVDSDIFFDKIIEIEKIPATSEFVYDFGIEGTENFVAGLGNILTHNSSVTDAICFALFGTFPALQSKRVSLEEIITGKPNKMPETRVKADFEYNGETYSVERTIKRKGTNQAKLLQGKKLLAGPKTTDVTKAVEKILDINYNLFSKAVYSEQNQIDFFLRLSPRERKEQFDELLDLKRFEKARGNAVSLANKIKDRVSERKDWLEKQKQGFDEREFLEIKKKISEKEKANEGISEKVLRGKKQAANSSEKIRVLESKEKEFNKKKETLIELQAQLKEVKKIVDEAKAGKKSAEIQSDLEKETGFGKKFAEEKEKIEGEIKCLQEKANSVIREQGLNEEKLLQLQKSVKELEIAKAECPVCRKPLDAETKAGIIAHNEKEKKAIAIVESEIRKRAGEVKKDLEEKNRLKRAVEKKIDESREKELNLKALLKEREGLDKKELDLKEFEKQAVQLQKELDQINFDYDTLKKEREFFVETKAIADSLEKEKKSNDELIGQFKENLKRLEETKKQLSELEDSIMQLENALEKTIIFTNALKAMQSELRSMLVENINLAMSDIWQKIYPYNDFTTAKLEIEEGSYELKVKDRLGNWVRVEGILSGGERSAAALCIRIAFSLVLTQNLSWLILDEPTHNLDANAVSVLSRLMREQLPELVDQIFVITHDREMERAASATTYLLQRNKEIDGATKPEQIKPEA